MFLHNVATPCSTFSFSKQLRPPTLQRHYKIKIILTKAIKKRTAGHWPSRLLWLKLEVWPVRNQLLVYPCAPYHEEGKYEQNAISFMFILKTRIRVSYIPAMKEQLLLFLIEQKNLHADTSITELGEIFLAEDLLKIWCAIAWRANASLLQLWTATLFVLLTPAQLFWF